MGQKEKFLITEEGCFDLNTYVWDDQMFSDLLVRENPINSDQALTVSKALKEAVDRLNASTITMSMIEAIIKEKLAEFGLTDASPIRMDRSIFKKNGTNLSDNARTVLERRYLKKNRKGEVIGKYRGGCVGIPAQDKRSGEGRFL